MPPKVAIVLAAKFERRPASELVLLYYLSCARNRSIIVSGQLVSAEAEANEEEAAAEKRDDDLIDWLIGRVGGARRSRRLAARRAQPAPAKTCD